MLHSSKDYEFLFDRTCEGINSAYKELNHKYVFRYRTKTIKSGDQLELEIYPLWNTRNEIRKARKAATREAQRNLNDKNAIRCLIRKINTNFTSEDICITLSYKGIEPDLEQARKDIRNYLRRVKDYRKKNGMSELKYIYVIEFKHEKGRKTKRIHHHVIMSGMDRDVAEKLWGERGWANTRRLQPDEHGLEALSRYVTKDPNGGKRWNASKNLKEPQVTTADTKISKRKVEQMAMDFDNRPREIFEKHFPSYVFNDCTIKRSEFVAGAYIYVRMHRRPPPAGKKKKVGLESDEMDRG